MLKCGEGGGGGGGARRVLKKKVLTEEERYQLDLTIEAECDRMKRQYLLASKNRSQYEQGTNKTIAQQKKILGIFNKEHENIMADLGVASSNGKKKIDTRNQNNLCLALGSFDSYSEKATTMKKHISELEGQIKRVNKEVLRLESLQISDFQYAERIRNAKTALETLENRLEVQIRKFCTVCARNRELRELINHLLYERRDFMVIWNKLINNLSKGKRLMLDFLEQATIAYDQREEWVRKLKALRNQAYNDLVQHTILMNECKRKEDNDSKLIAFYKIKSQRRVMRDLEAREHMKREETRQKMKETIAEYSRMIEAIKRFMGLTDLDAIVKKFVKQEEDNFMNFRYINDLNEEMDLVNDRLGELHMEIDRQKVLYEERKLQQKNTLDTYKKKVTGAVAETKRAEKELNDTEKNLATMLRGIGTLFVKCKCDGDPLLRLLGDNSSINYFNVSLYLEILEKKIHFLLLATQNRDFLNIEKRKIKPEQKVLTDAKIKPVLISIEQIATTNPCPLCVEHEYVSDVIDTLQKPLNRFEIEDKLCKRLQAPDGLARLHNVSACHLPKSREIISKRFQ